MRRGSKGSVTNLTAASARGGACVHVWGGPWAFDGCKVVQGGGGAALEIGGEVTLRGCSVGGCLSGRCDLGVHVLPRGKALVRGTTVSNTLVGLGVDEEGKCVGEGCVFRGGVRCFLAGGGKGSRVALWSCQVEEGDVEGEGGRKLGGGGWAYWGEEGTGELEVMGFIGNISGWLGPVIPGDVKCDVSGAWSRQRGGASIGNSTDFLVDDVEGVMGRGGGGGEGGGGGGETREWVR
jgi:hypothetical protein